jgi:divalent metal cation (Fe/Co/Zn/Cd) transporter
VQRRIAEAIESDENVVRLIHLRTEHLGPDELLVAAKIEFAPSLSMELLADVVNEVEAAVRRVVPEARVMYLEPDIARTPTAAIDPE